MSTLERAVLCLTVGLLAMSVVALLHDVVKEGKASIRPASTSATRVISLVFAVIEGVSIVALVHLLRILP